MLEYRPEGLLPGILAVHEGISAVIPHEKSSGIHLEPRPRVVSPVAHVVALNAFVRRFRFPIRGEGGRTAEDDGAVDLRVRRVEAPELDGVRRRIVDHESFTRVDPDCGSGRNGYVLFSSSFMECEVTGARSTVCHLTGLSVME